MMKKILLYTIVFLLIITMLIISFITYLCKNYEKLSKDKNNQAKSDDELLENFIKHKREQKIRAFDEHSEASLRIQPTIRSIGGNNAQKVAQEHREGSRVNLQLVYRRQEPCQKIQ